ncbi:MAG: ABC transporter ATP-binding protein [Sphaerochaetaceae bacterium]|nr:ABC transporter ATP-binding protein [Sphaerochaetaceae bacterium]
MEKLLEIKDLKVHFETREATIHAVNGISYTLHKGETIGIVGESGSGKTVSSMSLLKLIEMPPGKIAGGKALYKGSNLLDLSQNELREFRGKEIGVIFQDPMTSFNPVLTIGDQLTEGLISQGVSKKEAFRKAAELLEIVGIPSPAERLKDYPNTFSGGMRQRVMIAMGLISNPKIIIADEPTTALDVTVQAQIIDLVKNLKDKFGTSIIWITHDLGVVAGMADRVLVMYAGFIVEEAPVDQLYTHPVHPYTRGLLKSLPTIDDDERNRLASIPGLPPYMNRMPTGCPFAPRCSKAVERCFKENPVLEIRNGDPYHRAACWLD